MSMKNLPIKLLAWETNELLPLQFLHLIIFVEELRMLHQLAEDGRENYSSLAIIH
jgi:hypothetical protein